MFWTIHGSSIQSFFFWGGVEFWQEDELSKSIASCKVEADVLHTWINFLEDTWVLRCSYAEIKEKQVKYVLQLCAIAICSFFHLLAFCSFKLNVVVVHLVLRCFSCSIYCYLNSYYFFAFQVMNWRNMRTILWTSPLIFSLPTRYWRSFYPYLSSLLFFT